MSLATKAIGVGFARTGTTSLGYALEVLGYNHHGPDMRLLAKMQENRGAATAAALRKAARFTALSDWPWLLMYRELDAAFDAKFILTVRDEDKWLMSYRRMINRSEGVARDMIFSDLTDDGLLGAYREHNAGVLEYFDDVLVVDWTKHGWQELCAFLDKPVPDVPFPHMNASA